MKAAFAIWDDRISPVFDVASQIHVIEAESGRILTETQEVLPEDRLPQKALRLAEMGIATLVCGAISRPLHEMVVAYGIQVIPFVAGDLREVIQAWLSGTLDSEAFSMPGCCGRGRGRQFRGGCRWTPGERKGPGARRGCLGPRYGGPGRGRGSRPPGPDVADHGGSPWIQ